jgi:hypothetical protein
VETVVSPKEVVLESLSYTASEVVVLESLSYTASEVVVLESLSYTASEVVGGAGWVEPRAQECPKAVVWPKTEEW